MKINSDVTALITGGASGLGAATARLFSSLGAKVGLLDVNEEAGESLAVTLGAHFFPCDVTSDASVNAALSAARNAIGQERILINCAGTGAGVRLAGRERETGKPKAHPVKIFERIIQINLVGTFRCMAASAAGMLSLDPIGEDSERGVIINTSSVAAEDGQIGQCAYSASKAAVAGMTLPAARDMAREGVRVCTILPGLFDTPLFAGAPDKVKRSLEEMTPFPSRLGKPDEFAQLARSMCEISMFNGECVRLDGSIRMAPS